MAQVRHRQNWGEEKVTLTLQGKQRYTNNVAESNTCTVRKAVGSMARLPVEM